ncbi:MAG TPA: M56 family metallopeptidase [Solirubrobacteraceae bacterium]|jgi:Zn-dependent protease with chaperone function|nr:M56 family metallopeptidase [Solirubrobacteraceae bacterium]
MTTPASPTRPAALPAAALVKPAASAAGGVRRPAAIAARRAFGASLLLGVLGSASAVIVIARLFESWRVRPGPPSHAIAVFGQRLSYPAANAGAIVVTALAGLGLLMVGAAAWGVARELLAYRAFRRVIATRSPRLLDGAWVIDDARPQAFCAGLLRPRVYLSTGALELLDTSSLAAVLAHESQHARRRDPLRLACCRVLVAGLFFIPALRRLAQRQHALAELSADEAAVLSPCGDRSALANAMLSFSGAGGGDATGIDPERIDHLLGERIEWGLPVALFLGAAAALALLIATAVLAGQAAAGSATLAAPFLSGQPCVAVLAVIPAGGALAGWAYARKHRTPGAVSSAYATTPK